MTKLGIGVFARTLAIIALICSAATAVLTLAARTPAIAQAKSCKLEPPISVGLTLLSERRDEGFYRVAVRTGVEKDVPPLDVRVSLTSGARLVSGREAWRVKLRQRQVQRNELAIQTAPGRGTRLVVTAEARLEGAVLSRSAVLDWGPESRPSLPLRIRTDQHGRTFVEHVLGSHPDVAP